MSPSPSGNKPLSLRLAERIHQTTGKEHLPNICIAGFFLETVWHSVMERRVFKTSEHIIHKAIVRSAITWPAIYVVTQASIYWAAWRVGKQAKKRRGRGY